MNNLDKEVLREIVTDLSGVANVVEIIAKRNESDTEELQESSLFLAGDKIREAIDILSEVV